MRASFSDAISDLSSLAYQLWPPLLPYRFDRSLLPRATGSRGEPSIDVLTYNVEFSGAAGAAADRVIDAITQASADIVLLQETNPAWERRLASLEYRHVHYHHPTRQLAGGSAVLSRFPLAECRAISFGDVAGSVFPALACAVDTPAGVLRVVNVHLRPPLELSGGALLSSARTTASVRLGEARSLMRACPDADLVAGDFNEADGSAALATLAAAGFGDALAEWVPRRKETHLWPLARGLTLRKRLDHVAYRTARLACVGCGVLSGFEEGASDHQPVLARLVGR